MRKRTVMKCIVSRRSVFIKPKPCVAMYIHGKTASCMILNTAAEAACRICLLSFSYGLFGINVSGKMSF